MKVLEVIPAVAPRYGGPSQQALARCRALLAQGLDVLLATTSADGPGEMEVPYGCVVDQQGVPCRFFRRDFSESLKYSAGFSRWIGQGVREFDVVHIDAVFSHLCWSAGRACEAAGIPYLVRPLGTLHRYTYGQKTLRKRVAWRLFARRMLENADAILYTSEAERSDVQARFGLQRGTVIPNGVAALPTGWQNAALRPELAALCAHPFIACVCRLDPIKGLEDLISAFAHVTREPRAPGWRLVIAGEGDAHYVDSLRRLVRSAGVEATAAFVGWVSPAERTRLLADARLFALFSWHENFGVSVVEAMQCGTPVVVTEEVQIGGRIAAARAGWVVERRADTMRRVLAEAMGDASERERRGAAARALAETYLWDNVGAQHADLLRRLANGSAIS